MWLWSTVEGFAVVVLVLTMMEVRKVGVVDDRRCRFHSQLEVLVGMTFVVALDYRSERE